MERLWNLVVPVLVACVAGAETVWHEGATLPMEGRAFADAPAYGRLPERFFGDFTSDYARGIARNAAGLCARFVTDAEELQARWTVCEPDIAWVDMTGIVKSGFDVYQPDDAGEWRFVGVFEPWAGLGVKTTNFTARLRITPNRPCQINFPTYNTVGSFALGLEKGKSIRPAPPRTSGIKKPVVFYGTSITQGCSASRPGLAFTARVGRMLDVPVVNLGFSGNGKMTPSLLAALKEVDAAAYVIDCVWNMSEAEVTARTESFVRSLHAARPAASILLMQRVAGGGPTASDRHLEAVVEKLKKEDARAWRLLRLVRKEGMLPANGEGTVDGTHPNDLGMETLAAVCAKALRSALDLPQSVLELPPTAGNTRNSEGDFIVLKDGSILFVYSYFTGGGGDFDTAHLVSRVSRDGGHTWSQEPFRQISNHGGMNIMSVSLIRMKNGDIGLFYLVQNSEEDSRPVLRVSKDEGQNWSPLIECVPASEKGFYILNNCRVERLKSGRIVLPLCLHASKDGKVCDWAGKLLCVFSDDDGATWRRGRDCFATYDEKGKRVTTQEPGLIELKDGRLMMYARTYHGRQWQCYSSDGGDTWTKATPGPLHSPCSPATIKRLANGDLFAVWNDHERHGDAAKTRAPWGPDWARTPLTVAVSRDEGRTWIHRRILEGDPQGWYCYTAVCELDGRLLLGYCAEKQLQHSRVTEVPIPWLYAGRP